MDQFVLSRFILSLTRLKKRVRIGQLEVDDLKSHPSIFMVGGKWTCQFFFGQLRKFKNMSIWEASL